MGEGGELLFEGGYLGVEGVVLGYPLAQLQAHGWVHY